MSTLATQSLYSIEDHLQALLDTAEMAPPEQQAEIQAEIDRYLSLERSKVDRVAQFLATCEHGAAARRAEAKRLTEEAKRIEGMAERLEGYVCSIIEQRGVKKLEGGCNTFSLRQSDAVVVTNEEAIPGEYKKTVVTVSIDKTAIKKALKAGQEVPGCDLEFRNNLQRR